MMLICIFKHTLQGKYEQFKVHINGLVAKAQKLPRDGWITQDGTPWPGIPEIQTKLVYSYEV